MNRNLLIVESPHKAKTISQWLNPKEWNVFATAGHIKNLPKNDYGINEQHEGNFIVINEKLALLKKLKILIESCDNIFIGTDDDREGERIAYDIVQYYRIKQYYRVIFHEITKKAIAHALKNSFLYDQNKINAQTARRLIDRIIGYPVTSSIKSYFKKHKVLPEENIKKLGIGRVSAAALGIIVRKEKEIQSFVSRKYKNIYVSYDYNNKVFSVTNHIKYFENKKAELDKVLTILKNKTIPHVIESYTYKEREVSPYPPLVTTRVYRSLNYLFGFDPSYSRKILQRLYEGVDINGKNVGLITYPRTDSIYLNDEFVTQMIEFLKRNYKSEDILDIKRKYKNKNESAQEAHEAIRPTYMTEKATPEALKSYLDDDEYKAYLFIFYRTIATQFKNSIYDASKIVIQVDDLLLDAVAHKKIYKGWEGLLDEWVLKSEDENKQYEVDIPNIQLGEVLIPNSIDVITKDEKTPARYGVGRFITVLEDHYIGRPSTIADIPKNLKDRGLIKIANNMILPLETGMILYDFIAQKAEWMISIDHAKEFEEKLDLIEQGKFNYLDLVKEYDDLKDKFCMELGYDTSNKPPQWLLEKVRNIAEKTKIHIDKKIWDDKKALLKIYNNYKKSQEIGKCPICKKGKICIKENSYMCNNFDCKGIITKDGIYNFFYNFGIEMQEENMKEFVVEILKKKKLFIKDLYSKKKNKNFSAFVVLKSSKNFLNLELQFEKNIKTVDSKYIFSINNIKNALTDSQRAEENLFDDTDTGYIDIKEERRLFDKAYKDNLTRAWNRNKLEMDIQEIDNLDNITVAFIDGDKFKSINDTYGHDIGDEVLKFIVSTVYSVIRTNNKMIFYRFGGEEFLLVSKDTKENTLKALEVIKNLIYSHVATTVNKIPIKVTISIGVAFGENHSNFNSCVKAADKLVYIAKENGRNRIEIEDTEKKYDKISNNENKDNNIVKLNTQNNINMDDEIEW